ncbi:MAG: glycosyltransferase family 4 protein [Candidatus Hydrogenedentes bacterium]|nr:glycosyltransferase family 4 protein [Candidatus Hydrogenedentota bacterium]
MKRYRIAHVITRLCKGGAQENTFHSVRLADRERFEVDLISGPTHGSEGSIEAAVGAAGIAITRVPSLVRNPDPWHDARAYLELKRLFRERRYDIVHTHTSKAGYLGRMAAAHAGVPIIVHTPHGHIFFGYFNTGLTAFFTQLERQAARKTDRLIALTARGIDEHVAEGVGRREQWESIFSGIDLSPYPEAIARRDDTRRELGIPTEAFLAGAVGRLEPVKGFAYFIEAARAVLREAPDSHFVLAGDGSLSDELRTRAADLGERFRFLGLRHDVPDLMAAMDVCVVPSLNEGMGRVLLEAGAAGTPVAASAVGGIPDIVRDGGTGLLVPSRDVEALANAILRLRRDPVRRARMSTAAREAASGYSLECMVQRIESVYNTLIKEKGL